MSRKGPRIIAGVAAAGLAVLAAAALAEREEIAVRWHLGRLRSEPGRLLEVLAGPSGPLRQRAVERFLRTEEGRKELFGIHASTVLADILPVEGLPGIVAAIAWSDPGEPGTASYRPSAVHDREGRIGRKVHRGDPRVLAAVADRLPALRGTPFRIPAHPGVTFRFLSYGEVLESVPHLGGGPREREAIVCLIERDPREAVPILTRLLGSGAPDQTLAAAQALRALGPRAIEAAPALEALRGDVPIPFPEEYGEVGSIVVRLGAALALESIRGDSPPGPPEAGPARGPDDVAARRVLARLILGAAGRSPRTVSGHIFRCVLCSFYTARTWLNPRLDPIAFAGGMARNLAPGGKTEWPLAAAAWIEAFEAAGVPLTPEEKKAVEEAIVEAFDAIRSTGDGDEDDPGGPADGRRAARLGRLFGDLRDLVGAERFAPFAVFLRGLNFIVDGPKRKLRRTPSSSATCGCRRGGRRAAPGAPRPSSRRRCPSSAARPPPGPGCPPGGH